MHTPRSFARVVLLVFACGCAGTSPAERSSVQPTPPRPAPPPPVTECLRGPTPTAPPIPPNAATDERLVKILAFDCIKAEDIQQGEQPADAMRISKWMAGGPSGATWNANDLLCFADVETSCEQGQLSSVLRVGQRRVAEQKTAVGRAGSQQIQLTASERAWRPGLDQDKGSRGQPFRIAVFSLLIEAACKKPIEVEPGSAVFGDSADSSAFVAGFASGE